MHCIPSHLGKFPLYALPEEARQPLLQTFNPIDVFQLSVCSDATFELCKNTRLRPILNITFTKDYVIINVQSPGHLEMNIIVGRWDAVRGDLFNCFFDKEFFFECRQLRDGVVYPYGLDTVIRRFFSIYPSASVDNLNIDLHWNITDDDYCPLIRAIESVRNNGVVFENMFVRSYTTEWPVYTLEPLFSIAFLLQKQMKFPKVVYIQNGHNFPVSHYLDLGLYIAKICHSELNDEAFNHMVHQWNTSHNTHFKGIIVKTTQTPCKGSLVRGIRCLEVVCPSDPFSFRIQRPTDGMMASIVRKSHEFVFTIGV